MSEEELNKKADEHIQKNMVECIQEQIEYFEFAKQSYIKGAKDNGVVWHDLKKDPDDLPKKTCSVLVVYEYDDRTYTDQYIYDKENNIIGWASEYKDPYCAPIVIAWCEKPRFEVKK